MTREISVCLSLLAILSAGAYSSATASHAAIVVNTIVFDNDDTRRNREAMRHIRSVIRVDGTAYVWVVLNPQVIGFNVLQETLSDEERRHQTATLRQALDTVLADLHRSKQIQRAPSYYQYGVSELVKVTDHKVLRQLLGHRYVQQLTLYPEFGKKQ